MTTIAAAALPNTSGLEEMPILTCEKWMEEEFDILANFLFDESEGSLKTEDTLQETPADIATSTSSSLAAAVSPVTQSNGNDSRSLAVISPTSTMTSSDEEETVTTKKRRVVSQDGEDTTSSSSTYAAVSSSSSIVTATVDPTSLRHKKATSDAKKSFVPIAPMPSLSQAAKVGTLTSSSIMGMVMPKRNAAKETFLKAVAVATQETGAAWARRVVSSPAATSSGISLSAKNVEEMSAREQLDFRRERNRILARQTRERKKTQLSSLKRQFLALQHENAKLKRIVETHVPLIPQVAILQDCTALEKISPDVWDAIKDKCPVALHPEQCLVPLPLLSSTSSSSSSSVSSEEPEIKEDTVMTEVAPPVGADSMTYAEPLAAATEAALAATIVSSPPATVNDTGVNPAPNTNVEDSDWTSRMLQSEIAPLSPAVNTTKKSTKCDALSVVSTDDSSSVDCFPPTKTT